jgi:hypothetical protein
MSEFNSPCSSPCGFQIRSCFDSLPETPVCDVLFGNEDALAVDLFSSPAKMQKIDEGTSFPISGPPEAPRKVSKKPVSPIEGLPVLPEDFKPIILKKIGKGSFGNVFQVCFLSDDSFDRPLYAMKVIKVVPGGCSSQSDLRKEASNYGSPKCNVGFGMSSHDGRNYYGFSTIAQPLDTVPITSENIKNIIDMTKDAIMKAKFSLITDANPGNLGIIRAGTPTPILGEDGLPHAGSPVKNNEVVFIDLGDIESPNDCNGKYGALFDEREMDSEEEQLKYRKFKCDMISALLRNRILAEPRNEFNIVREICNSEPYGYTYAAGDRR